MFEKITTVIKRGLAWGREVAAERDGTASSSRVVCLMVASACIGVLIAHVAMNRCLPAAEQMYGLSAVIASGAGAYATNRIRSDSQGQYPRDGRPEGDR